MKGPKNKRERRYVAMKSVSIVLTFVTVYTAYVYIGRLSYSYVYQQVSKVKGGAFIGVSVLELLIVLVCFVRICVEGPGLLDRKWTDFEKPYAGNGYDVDAPDAFICEQDGRPRWCHVCMKHKPDRAHHSSEIGKCVLKMDHYCQYLGKVIGYANYRFFWVMLLHAVILLLFWIITTGYYLAAQVRDGIVEGFIISSLAIEVLVLLGAAGLFVQHCYMISVNKTTIEYMSPNYQYFINLKMDDEFNSRVVVFTEPGGNPWTIGLLNNWKAVFGSNPLNYVLPISRPSDDGMHFAYNQELLNQLKSNYLQSVQQPPWVTTTPNDPAQPTTT
ncbi:hypothetical protein CANCADRAFT_30236 [Tortispora caseinolytica NRRL Y-17796]|uniref:Palmitoyltransferase n=1 Tax=Tortispora caseinolytica NRRL Y-17796 TaxID=767744 RepID=A0A1E4TJM4_9ASCO|nr:hypothetical protein CANCADRAFT_30236 [Tortispora caseinolytica NRRL Y-17796]